MSLKEEGEELARLAQEEDIVRDQLRKIFTQASSRSRDDLEAFIKYQIGRRIFSYKFGERALGLLEKYGGKMEDFREVLRYAIMLYDYLKLKASMNLVPFRDIMPQISEAIRGICMPYGFKGVEPSIGRKRDTYIVNVILSDFHGPRKEFANKLKNQILRTVPDMSKYKFLVWIK